MFSPLPSNLFQKFSPQGCHGGDFRSVAKTMAINDKLSLKSTYGPYLNYKDKNTRYIYRIHGHYRTQSTAGATLAAVDCLKTLVYNYNIHPDPMELLGPHNSLELSIRILSIRILSIRILSIRILSIRILSIRILSIRILSIRILSIRILSIRILSIRILSIRICI